MSKYNAGSHQGNSNEEEYELYDWAIYLIDLVITMYSHRIHRAYDAFNEAEVRRLCEEQSYWIQKQQNLDTQDKGALIEAIKETSGFLQEFARFYKDSLKRGETNGNS